MSVQITQSKTVIQKFDGTSEEKNSVKCEIRCDGPKCGKPDSACLGQMEWTEEKPEDVPDQFFRMILFKVGNEKGKNFFSRECMRDYLRDWTPPLSPRELAEIEKTRAPKTEEPISTTAVFQNADSDATGAKE